MKERYNCEAILKAMASITLNAELSSACCQRCYVAGLGSAMFGNGSQAHGSRSRRCKSFDSILGSFETPQSCLINIESVVECHTSVNQAVAKLQGRQKAIPMNMTQVLAHGFKKNFVCPFLPCPCRP